MIELMKMNRYITTTDGVFSWLFNAWDDCPWSNIFETPLYLDMLYYSRSGNKYASPLLRNSIPDPDHITDRQKINIAATILAMYSRQWVRAFSTLNELYDILNTYKITTTADERNTADELTTDKATGKTTRNDTETQGDTISESKSGTRIIGDDETTESDRNRNNNEARNVYGFNTTDPDGVPESKGTSSETNNDKETRKSTTNDETTETTTAENSSARSLEGETTSENNGTKQLEGVTTGHRTETRTGYTEAPQDRIMKEIEISKIDYFNSVMEDIDKLITLSVY